MEKLPVEIIIKVILNLKSLKDIDAFGFSCKYINKIVSVNNLIAKARRIVFPIDPPYHISERNYFELLTGTGCQKCGNKRTRKINWELGFRLCKDCIITETIRDYEIKHESESVLQCMPLVIVDITYKDIYYRVFSKRLYYQTIKEITEADDFDEWKIFRIQDIHDTYNRISLIEMQLDKTKEIIQKRKDAIRFEKLQTKRNELSRLIKSCGENITSRQLYFCEPFRKSWNSTVKLNWNKLKPKVEEYLQQKAIEKERKERKEYNLKQITESIQVNYKEHLCYWGIEAKDLITYGIEELAETQEQYKAEFIANEINCKFKIKYRDLIKEQVISKLKSHFTNEEYSIIYLNYFPLIIKSFNESDLFSLNIPFNEFNTNLKVYKQKQLVKQENKRKIKELLYRRYTTCFTTWNLTIDNDIFDTKTLNSLAYNLGTSDNNANIDKILREANENFTVSFKNLIRDKVSECLATHGINFNSVKSCSVIREFVKSVNLQSNLPLCLDQKDIDNINIAIENNQKRFRCEICNSRLFDYTGLQQHNLAKHRN